MSPYIMLPAPFLPSGSFHALRTECRKNRSTAWKCEKRPDSGFTAQRNHRAELGPAARSLAKDPALQHQLEIHAGCLLQPSYSASSYTYYERAGDYLTRHCDRPDLCSVTLLVYLDMLYPLTGPGDGLSLIIYTNENGTEISQRVTPRPNFAMLLRGDQIPHERPPLSAGEYLSLLSICFHP